MDDNPTGFIAILLIKIRLFGNAKHSVAPLWNRPAERSKGYTRRLANAKFAGRPGVHLEF